MQAAARSDRIQSTHMPALRLQPPPTPPESGGVGGGCSRGESANRIRLSDAATIAVFLAGIIGFGVLSLAKSPDVQSLARENRKPAPPPAVPLDYQALKKTPAQIEQYFNDRIAFRESLLRWHAVARFELGASPTEKVLIGRDGWLFMNEPKTESNTGRAPSQEMLADAWAETFRRRGQWLAQRGIQYLVIPAPDKQAIYPEFMPDGARLTPLPCAGELLGRKLEGDPAVEFIALRPLLQQAKRERAVYYRTDTHWNEDGAYVAYRAILERLAKRWPNVKPLDRQAFDEKIEPYVGDLTRMLRLPEDIPEQAHFLHPRRPSARRINREVPLDDRLWSPRHIEPQVWGTGNAALPRAVLFHDSFAERLLLPVLAEHFEWLVFCPSESGDPNVIERFHPDLVIHELVERKINWQKPFSAPGFGQ